MFLQNGVNGAAQIPNPFAVNDAHLENPSLLTLRQIVQHQVFHLAWLECVQIEHAINRKLDGLIHISRLLPFGLRESIDSCHAPFRMEP